jgi:23S rRNA (adenine2030-N6)-methyltransferase
MNYRHAFHAGNFADVHKHAVLARILVHLKAKPAPFRVIDTHAGAGRHDLTGPEATRTGEWRDGIGRLLAAALAPSVRTLLAPYLDVVAALNPPAHLATYPGSPEIARSHLRPQDRLVACELEPSAAQALAHAFRADRRVKTVAIDGWTALTAYVPPKERRGVVLIDPAFEQPNELARMLDRFAAAHRKWPSGTYVLWYPIKGRGDPQGRAERETLARRIRRLGIPRILRSELIVAQAQAVERLDGSGVIIANPPWTLESELATLVPALATVLARGDAPAARLDWIAAEM